VVEWEHKKWTGCTARIWQVMNEHKLLARQLKPLVRQRRKVEDNINMDLTTMKTALEYRPVASQFNQHLHGFDFQHVQKLIFSPDGSGRLWGPIILIFRGFRELSPRDKAAGT
jgi:hypothetical protein